MQALTPETSQSATEGVLNTNRGLCKIEHSKILHEGPNTKLYYAKRTDGTLEEKQRSALQDTRPSTTPSACDEPTRDDRMCRDDRMWTSSGHMNALFALSVPVDQRLPS